MHRLFDRIFGSILGGAAGDTLGKAAGGLGYAASASQYDNLSMLLAGPYTDSVRLSHQLLRAAVQTGVSSGRGDGLREFVSYHGDTKNCKTGSASGSVMSYAASLGILFPADTAQAFWYVFHRGSNGSHASRKAAALGASAVSAAMDPSLSPKEICIAAVTADEACGGKEKSGRYGAVAENQQARLAVHPVILAVGLGCTAANIFSVEDKLLEYIHTQVCAEESNSVAAALAMLCVSEGNFKETVIRCAHLESAIPGTAFLGGMLAGACCGMSGIDLNVPAAGETGNPKQLFEALAEILTGSVMRMHWHRKRVVKQQERFIFTDPAASGGAHVHPVSDEVLACGSEHTAKLQRALDAGSDPDIRDAQGKTLLHKVCAKGLVDHAAILLRYGADVHARDANMTTPLHFAAWENHLPCVRLLLENGAFSDLTEGTGWTAVHDAVRREYGEITCELLAGADNGRRRDILMKTIAGLTGDQLFLGLLQMLVSSQVTVAAVGICGQSLLHDAVQRGYPESVRFLLSHGADSNQLALTLGSRRYEGTPLHKAAAHGRHELYAMLKQAGADESILNIDGKTPQELFLKKDV